MDVSLLARYHLKRLAIVLVSVFAVNNHGFSIAMPSLNCVKHGLGILHVRHTEIIDDGSCEEKFIRGEIVGLEIIFLLPPDLLYNLLLTAHSDPMTLAYQ
jgi:hypothetical protein